MQFSSKKLFNIQIISKIHRRFSKDEDLRFNSILVVGLAAVMSILFVISAHAEQMLPTYSVSLEDIQKRVSDEIIQQGAADQVKVTLANIEKHTVYGSDTPLSFDVQSLEFDAARKSWSANLAFISEGKTLSVVPAGGKYHPMVMLPSAKKRIETGQIITARHLISKAFPAHYSRKDVVTDAVQLTGFVARRGISPGRPIRSREITTETIVKKGSNVQIHYTIGGLHISTNGEALEDAGQGELVKIRNANSGEIIRAIAEDSQTVSVKPMKHYVSKKGEEHAFNQ